MVSLSTEDVTRVAELVHRYDDLPLGTTDASVIALAERLSIDEIATLDHRHVRVVRPRHVDAFTLLPEVVYWPPAVRNMRALRSRRRRLCGHAAFENARQSGR